LQSLPHNRFAFIGAIATFQKNGARAIGIGNFIKQCLALCVNRFLQEVRFFRTKSKYFVLCKKDLGCSPGDQTNVVEDPGRPKILVEFQPGI
jgi:hypothetical protein